MADPFSLFASVVGVLDVALRSSKALHSLQSNLRNAPDFILALANEIEDIRAVLVRAEDTMRVSEASGIGTPISTAIIADLAVQLDKARTILVDLDSLAQKLMAESPTRKRVKWYLKKSQASGLQRELKEVRTRINDLFTAHHSLSSTQIQLKVQDVRLEIQQNQQATFQRLGSNLQATSSEITTLQRITEQHHREMAGVLRALQASVLERAPEWRQSVNAELQEVRDKSLTNNQAPFRNESNPKQGRTAIQRLISDEILKTVDNRLTDDSNGEDKASTQPGREEMLSPDVEKSSLSVFLTMIRSQCQRDCPCACHTRRRSHFSWGLPKTLEALLGSLFIGYTVYPAPSAECKFTSCSNDRLARITLKYAFPFWFANYSVHAFFQVSRTREITLGLTPRRRIPYSPDVGNILYQISRGRLSAVQHILHKNRAAIWDVHHRSGSNVLGEALKARVPWIERYELLRTLICAGANPDLEDDKGISARHIAAMAVASPWTPLEDSSGLQEVFRLTNIADYLELNFLHQIVLEHCHADLDAVLQSHSEEILAQINDGDLFGATPLINAIRKLDIGMVRALLNAGADVSLQSKYGSTALLELANADTSIPQVSELMDLLLKAGADIYVTDWVGRSALDRTVHANNTNTVETLLSVGFDINMRDHISGHTTLHMAASSDSTQVLELLLARGADINATDNFGRTPLVIALSFNSYAAQILLLEHGANHLLRSTYENDTLLHEAARYGDEITMEILTRFELTGLYVGATNNEGLTASDIFEMRTETSESLRPAFQQLLRVVDSKQLQVDEVEDDSDDTDEEFVDAFEY